MLKLFLDANVLISMVRSERGASYELYMQAQSSKRTLALYVSDHVKEEALDVFTRIHEHAKAEALTKILAHPLWHEVTTSVAEDIEAEDHIEDPDDAPVIAAAKKAHVDALVSFDRKHLHTAKVEQFIGAPVITAGDALTRLQA